MLAGIVAPGVMAAETLAFDDVDPLLPEELAALGTAVEKRRHEFAAGRSCARTALAALGVPSAPILRGPRRQPLWPDGVVGSITHCAGYCGAAVARRSRFRSIGIDAEPHVPLSEPIVRRVTLPAEREWLRAHADSPIAWDKVLFCAKESVYKAWFPLAERWLGFEDAHVSFDPDAGTFEARLLTPLDIGGRRIDRIDGRMRIAGGFVLTFVSIPAPTDDA